MRNHRLNIHTIKSVLLALLVCAFLSSNAYASRIIGYWDALNEDTGEVTTVVRIEQRGFYFYGVIDAIKNPDRADAICDLCTDDRANQPLQGLEIIRSMISDGDKFNQGSFLDPDTGQVYEAKMQLSSDGSRLTVGGFAGEGLFGHSFIWYRSKDQSN